MGINSKKGEPDQLIIEYICLNFLFSFEKIPKNFNVKANIICIKDKVIKIKKNNFHGDSIIDKYNSLYSGN